MTPEEIRALFALQRKAFALRDAAAFAAAYADNCVLESPAAGTVIGRAGIENIYRHYFLAFPDMQIDPGDLLINGDQVVSTSVVSGTDTGGFLGQAATGKPFRFFIVQLSFL